ncbi:MAG: hypothetical protein N4A45_01085 [Flavobacteriales bacterium]|jgi:hypothetical protein|nr:hypothetical protein [Flavobacteriales bacterium]
MFKAITKISLLITTLLVFTSCNLLKPEKISSLVTKTSYHYYTDVKTHDRGIKFYIVFTGEKLEKVKPISFKIGEHTLEAIPDLYEPTDRDLPSILTCTALFKEKIDKVGDYVSLPNSLYGKEPFKNAIFTYRVGAKEYELPIKEFVLNHKLN